MCWAQPFARSRALHRRLTADMPVSTKELLIVIIAILFILIIAIILIVIIDILLIVVMIAIRLIVIALLHYTFLLRAPSPCNPAAEAALEPHIWCSESPSSHVPSFPGGMFFPRGHRHDHQEASRHVAAATLRGGENTVD